MKRKPIIACILVATLFTQHLFAQGPRYTGPEFVKRVENNIRKSRLELILPDGSVKLLYNLESKSDIENLFFGEFNAPVEYFINPEFESASGFRIVKDSVKNSYLLEIKTISNYDEIRKELDDKYPAIGFKNPGLIPDSILKQSAVHNRVMALKRIENSLELSQIKTLSFPVSSQFAEKLHQNMAALIDDFDGSPSASYMGYWVTFRCVVGNKVMTLLIKDGPQGKAFQLFGLCQQVINDGIRGKLDEPKYMELLNQMK